MQSYSTHRSVLISTISAKGFSTITIGFLIATSCIMLISMGLPSPYAVGSINSTCSQSSSNLYCLDDHIAKGTNFTVKISEIAATNQKVYVYLTYQVHEAPRGRVKMTVNSAIYKPNENVKNATKYDQVTLFDATTKTHHSFCDSESLDCSMLLTTVESSKKYKDTYVVFNVTSAEISKGLTSPRISIVYSTAEYTSFEVFWRIALLVTMSCFCVFYMVVLRDVPFKHWSLEQKCTFIFMIGLTISNNGMYSYEFISANEFFPAINAIFDAMMICSLLLYILIVMDALRKPLSQRTFLKFYLPRCMLVIVLYAFLVNVYLYNAEASDPIMVMLHDTTNLVMVIFTAIFSALYLFWLLFAVIRSFSEARKLGEVGQRIKSYGTFTLMAMVILFMLILSDYFIGYKSNQGIYLTLIGYVNIYAIVLMIFYLPSNKERKEWNNKRKEIVLDEMKVTEYDDEDNALIIDDDMDIAEERAIQNVTDELLNDNEKPIEL